jgi:CheY-like chemotaxis protein
MNAILGYTELLGDADVSPEDHGEFLGIIQNNCRHLMGLINDILDLSKIEAHKLEIRPIPVNPHSLIDEVRAVFEPQIMRKNLSFEVIVDQSLPVSLIIDGPRLRQILFNLIGNAVKFTSEGSIRVSVRSTPVDSSSSHVALQFAVADSGIGIPSESIEAIFRPFRQLDSQSSRVYTGTGLGLAISRRLAEAMGGMLSAESLPGAGSTFTLSLDRVSVSPVSLDLSRHSEPLPQINAAIAGATILLVEDEPLNRQVLREFLSSQHLTVLEAENGQDALRVLEHQRPDLILMDMQMPIMNGEEAIAVIRSDNRWNRISILALSGSGTPVDGALEVNGADGRLKKPVEREDLIRALSRFLAGSGRSAAKLVANQANGKSGSQNGNTLTPPVARSEHAPDWTARLAHYFSSRKESPEELAPLFYREILTASEGSRKSLSVNRTMDAGRRIKDLGRGYSSAVVAEFGTALYDSADLVDIQEMTGLLGVLPQIMEFMENRFPQLKKGVTE